LRFGKRGSGCVREGGRTTCAAPRASTSRPTRASSAGERSRPPTSPTKSGTAADPLTPPPSSSLSSSSSRPVCARARPRPARGAGSSPHVAFSQPARTGRLRASYRSLRRAARVTHRPVRPAAARRRGGAAARRRGGTAPAVARRVAVRSLSRNLPRSPPRPAPSDPAAPAPPPLAHRTRAARLRLAPPPPGGSRAAPLLRRPALRRRHGQSAPCKPLFAANKRRAAPRRAACGRDVSG
jgi:hypothetical protein